MQQQIKSYSLFYLKVIILIISASASLADSRFCMIQKNAKTICNYQSIVTCRQNIQDSSAYCVPNPKFKFVVSGKNRFCIIDKNYALCAYSVFKNCNEIAIRKSLICSERGVLTRNQKNNFFLYQDFLK